MVNLDLMPDLPGLVLLHQRSGAYTAPRLHRNRVNVNYSVAVSRQSFDHAPREDEQRIHAAGIVANPLRKGLSLVLDYINAGIRFIYRLHACLPINN